LEFEVGLDLDFWILDLLLRGYQQLNGLNPFFVFRLYVIIQISFLYPMENINGNNNLNRQQKMGFVLLLIFGLLAVGLGAIQMRNSIYLPLASKTEDKTNETGSNFLDQKTLLQKIDTDQDGLNDYEELEFYKTSPYLPDTDSDGVDDKTEITKGTDPLCPEGKNCGVAVTGATKATTTVGVSVNSSGTTSTADILTIAQDPKLLREMLAKSGKLTPEQLAEIDDATLLQMASEALIK
jgi:hypothetical protein